MSTATSPTVVQLLQTSLNFINELEILFPDTHIPTAELEQVEVDDLTNQEATLSLLERLKPILFQVASLLTSKENRAGVKQNLLQTEWSTLLAHYQQCWHAAKNPSQNAKITAQLKQEFQFELELSRLDALKADAAKAQQEGSSLTQDAQRLKQSLEKAQEDFIIRFNLNTLSLADPIFEKNAGLLEHCLEGKISLKKKNILEIRKQIKKIDNDMISKKGRLTILKKMQENKLGNLSGNVIKEETDQEKQERDEECQMIEKTIAAFLKQKKDLEAEKKVFSLEIFSLNSALQRPQADEKCINEAYPPHLE